MSILEAVVPKPRNAPIAPHNEQLPTFYRVEPDLYALGSRSLEKVVFRKISDYLRNPWKKKKTHLLRGIQVDLSKLRFLGCSESAWLALALHSIGRLVGGPIGLTLPTDMRAMAFLNRWKFLDTPAFSSGSVLVDNRSLSRYEAASGYYDAVPGISPKLVEFRTVRIDPLPGVPSQDLPFESLLTRIEFVLQHYVGWRRQKQLVHVFCDVFLRELLANIFEHAEVDFGLIAMQTHSGVQEHLMTDSLEWEKSFVAENPEYVELFVGDSGSGIERTLGVVVRKQNRSASPDDILAYACERGSTSKPLDKERRLTTRRKGMGLFYVTQRVKDWQGAVQLRSGTGLLCCAYLKSSGWTTFSTPIGGGWSPCEFAGTQVKILLPARPPRHAIERLSSPL
jgi:hypothetical protein